MFKKISEKFFGNRYDREMKKNQPIIEQINSFSDKINNLNDDELRERVSQIKADIRDSLAEQEQELEDFGKAYQTEPNENKKNSIGNEIDVKKKKLKQNSQEILDEYLPEVFAIIKETCKRLIGFEYEIRGDKATWEMIPYDVQLIGGLVLHQGKIAEMATGEGKTLVAVLPLFLNALLGRGVHLITVNDYLAQRDSEWMSPVFLFHGLTISCVINGMDSAERKEAYNCDVTYGTNSEFGFDYLRDNMAVSEKQLAQRKHQFAIVDEVDSVLIDEARTPLIISGAVKESKNFYSDLHPVIRKLVNSQDMLAKRFLSETKIELNKEEYDPEIVGKLLLLVSRAAPKNKSYIKLMKEAELKKLRLDYEGYYIRDKKMHEIDAELFYAVEEKQNSVELAEKGHDLVEVKYPDLFLVKTLDEALEAVEADENLSFEQKSKKKENVTSEFFDKNEKLHNIKQLLKAYTLFEKEVDYVVVDNKVMIVDSYTGRMMPGRRFSDGLHQALEAKEKVRIEEATQTFATITLQNYFRMYDKLSGMTGTAITEEHEFLEIYELPVIVIPTNAPISREDHNDMIYLTKNEKYKAIIDEIIYWHETNKPVLVGTVSVEVSETLSRLLRRRNIKHNVLNAKYHESEADIVKGAGQPGAVTIATNMAGRGTDIKLGSGVVTKSKPEYLTESSKITDENPYGAPLDGLHVIGTERHESRRIDRQLRGRSGRQGDPGTSRFYLSLEDDLMRLFGSERIAPMMMKMGLSEGEAITHPWMTNAVEKAQKRVEGFNFESRKQLIKYDEVMNQQREVIYTYRRNVLKGYDLKFEIEEMIKDAIEYIASEYITDEIYHEQWQIEKLLDWLKFNLNVIITKDEIYSEHPKADIVKSDLIDLVIKSYEKREELLSAEQMREIERRVLLSVVDDLWRDHLHEMDLLKEGIGLRAYAQKDPLIEYKRESFELFQTLILNINKNVMQKVFTTYLVAPEQVNDFLKMARQSHAEISAFGQKNPPKASPESTPQAKPKQIIRASEKVGRNDPCPCGSGKKYKKCCGKVNAE